MRGRALQVTPDTETTLITTELTAESGLHRAHLRISCPSESFATQDRIPLTRLEQPTRLLSRPVLTAEIHNSQGELVHTTALDAEAQSLQLDDGWAEGNYTLTLTSQDAFELNAPAQQSTCQIHLDRTAPSIDSSLNSTGFYDESNKIRRLAPEEKIAIKIEDANGATPYVCVKPYPASCTEEDFLPLHSITAPSRGIWEIVAYATDKAGQKSTVLREVFAVYHQEDIDRLLARLPDVRTSLFLGGQPLALAAMRDAQIIRKNLELDGELDAIRWPYIESFWRLDQQLNYLRTIDVGFPISSLSLITSPYSLQFLVKDLEETAVFYRNESEAIPLDHMTHSAFSASGALWTLKSGVLKLYENGRLVRTFNTDLGRSARLAAGAVDKVVIWQAHNFEEMLVRVYDRTTRDDNPIFEAILPRYKFEIGRYAFFAQDRYLIGSSRNKLLIWDSLNDYAIQSFQATEGCVIGDFAVRSDHEIYYTSKKTRITNTGYFDSENSFCDLHRVDILNSSLHEILTPRLTKVTSPGNLSLSSDPSQKYLVLEAGSFFNLLDLEDRGSNLGFPLNQDEDIYQFSSISTERPMFLLSTSQRTILLQMTSFSDPAVPFSGDRLGNCAPHTHIEKFLCFHDNQHTLDIYTSDRNLTLQPSLFHRFTDFSPPDLGDKFLIASLLTKPLHAIFERETNKIWLQDENKLVRAQAILPAEATALSLHHDGRLAVGLDNGTLAVIEEGKAIKLTERPQSKILDVHITASQGIFVLRQLSNNMQSLEIFTDDIGGLTLQKTLHLPSSQTFNKIMFSEEAGYGVLYLSDDSRPVTQEVLVFAANGSERGRIPMTACTLEPSRKRPGFYFGREQSIYFHDFQSGSDQLIADSLPYSPCTILEGNKLFATDIATLYAVDTGQRLDSGLNFSIGPQGTILIETSDSIKVLSPDGLKTLVNLPHNDNIIIDQIISDPDHPEFVMVITDHMSGQGIRRFTTDLDAIDQLLSNWGR